MSHTSDLNYDPKFVTLLNVTEKDHTNMWWQNFRTISQNQRKMVLVHLMVDEYGEKPWETYEVLTKTLGIIRFNPTPKRCHTRAYQIDLANDRNQGPSSEDEFDEILW